MNILFFAHTVGRLRNFESVVVGLVGRGHHVRLAVADKGDLTLPANLSGPAVSLLVCPARRGDRWKPYARPLRRIRDYLKYLSPPFRKATGLRTRAREAADCVLSRGLTWVFRWPFTARYVVHVDRGLQWVEDHIPSDQAMEAFLQTHAPDVVLVSPLVQRGSEYQVDYVKSCHRLGIPVAVLPFSWDHLTNKGLMRIVPDRVFVWNDAQKQEATAFHGIPAGIIDVCGAWRFDEFYDRRPGSTREEFCRAVGLDPGRPLITYVCSSEFTAPEEETFVREWIQTIRASTAPALRECGIVIRPYPDKLKQWRDIDAGAGTFVMVGDEWRDRRTASWSDQGLYESLYHSDAVVGINTSAMIEAGILSKPVFTVVVKRYDDGQSKTLHFQHLMQVAGGLVNVAHALDEHRSQLEQSLAGERSDRCSKSDRFVEAFVRPAGLDRPALPAVLDKIEDLRHIDKAPISPASQASALQDRLHRCLQLVKWSLRKTDKPRFIRDQRDVSPTN